MDDLDPTTSLAYPLERFAPRSGPGSIPAWSAADIDARRLEPQVRGRPTRGSRTSSSARDPYAARCPDRTDWGSRPAKRTPEGMIIMGTIESSETLAFADALRAQRTTSQYEVDSAANEAHDPQARWTAKQAHSAACAAAH